MKKETHERDEAGGDNESVSSLPESFTCNHELCRISGRPNIGTADDMFNLPCNPRKLKPEQLLALVVCRRCAGIIASDLGLHVKEPGCGTYPLKHTLALMKEAKDAPKVDYREKRLRDEQDYVAWILSRQKEREEAEAVKKLAPYAERFAFHAHETEASGWLPQAVEINGNHFCGLPREIGCCSGEQPAERYIGVRGQVVGICRVAALAFLRSYREHPQDGSYAKLLSTRDLAKAKEMAKSGSACVPDDADEEKPNER